MSKKNSKQVNKKKWVTGNVLYSPLNHKLYCVMGFHGVDKYRRGLAIVDDGEQVYFVSVWPESTPGVDVWQCLGAL